MYRIPVARHGPLVDVLYQAAAALVVCQALYSIRLRTHKDQDNDRLVELRKAVASRLPFGRTTVDDVPPPDRALLRGRMLVTVLLSVKIPHIITIVTLYVHEESRAATLAAIGKEYVPAL